MAHMGYGYGSECHLLRWMGRHRRAFDVAVCAALGKQDGPVDWLDMRFYKANPWPDAELKGVEFISDAGVLEAWGQWWPTTGNTLNWDAVGHWSPNAKKRLVLLEAKANFPEIRSRCSANARGGRPRIEQSLRETAQALEVTDIGAWMDCHYQFANRLAARHFLRAKAYEPHLLMIYFVGDRDFPSRKAPQTVEAWIEPLNEQKRMLGLETLPADVHELFLHVHEPVGWRREDSSLVEMNLR